MAQAQELRRPMLLALAGFAMLSCGDAVIKSMAGAWPGTAVAALRFTIGAVGLAVIIAVRSGRRGFYVPRPQLQLARGAMLAGSSLAFFIAVFAMPLAEATAIGFISPLLAGGFSWALLAERPPAIIWLASALAFAGVLIVLRPNVAELGFVAVLPLGAAAGFALMLVLNRMVAGLADVLLMQFLISAVAAPLLIVATLIGEASGVRAFAVSTPDLSVVARCTLVAVTATLSHVLIYSATTLASAGRIAPMVYIQLIVAMILGFVFYRDTPDATAMAGAALIISGGLLLWFKNDQA